MFNATVIFSRELSVEELQRARDLTYAKSILEVSSALDNLSEFGRIVLGIPDLFDIKGYIFKNFHSLSFLCASELQPVMIFQDQEGVLDTILKYGELIVIAEYCERSLDILKRHAKILCEGKRQLGLDLNEKIIRYLDDDIWRNFEEEFADILRAARDYYSVVSQVEV